MNRRRFLKSLGLLMTVPVIGENFSKLIPRDPQVFVEVPRTVIWQLPPPDFTYATGGFYSMRWTGETFKPLRGNIMIPDGGVWEYWDGIRWNQIDT